MFGMVLSIFDQIYGPRIFLKVPDINFDFSLDRIPCLMDLYDKGFIIHEYGVLKTANLVFKINSPLARGGYEYIMFSVVSYQEPEEINLHSFKEIIEDFISRLLEIPNLYKGFHSNELYEGIKVYNEINDLFYSFYDNFSKFNTFDNQHFLKKIVYELSPLAKKAIIDSTEETFTSIENKYKLREAELLRDFKLKAIKKKKIFTI